VVSGAQLAVLNFFDGAIERSVGGFWGMYDLGDCSREGPRTWDFDPGDPVL